MLNRQRFLKIVYKNQMKKEKTGNDEIPELKQDDENFKKESEPSQLNPTKVHALMKISFLSREKFSTKFITKYKFLFNYFNNKFKTTISLPITGNIIDEPIIEDKQAESNEYPINLLQNTLDLNNINIENMKEEVNKTDINWSTIFTEEDIFNRLEDQLREDIKNNGVEMIIIDQTLIANKFLSEYEKLRKKIPKKKEKQLFLYHGTPYDNHQSIVKNHFLMPGQDKFDHRLDSGFFGKGIAATENLFYATMYSNRCKVLSFNEKANVIACIAIYNKSYVKYIDDLSYIGKEIDSKISENCGIHYAFVGSSRDYQPIPEYEKDSNFIAGGEFIFPNKYQIIPLYSFTVIRADHFILWKNELIETKQFSDCLNELLKKTFVNIYCAKSVDESIDIINRKKRNQLKLIINVDDNDELKIKFLIDKARKIFHSNFVCLVLSSSIAKNISLLNMENVLITESLNDIQKFISLELNESCVLDFANELDRKYNCSFKLNKKELLSFPTTLESFYES